ncbi:MAG: HPr-rel-A system PqqD family peptide chaperone [Ignavibacteria bacterium]|nr:HPr-rel-A system PqqD family peptide chaperone [Ignavibacteria bacterium]
MKINKKVAISETGFVYDTTTGDSYSLNPIAIEIIEYLRKDMNLEEITRKLLEKYDVSKTVLEKSLNDFISALKSYNILIDE